MGILQIAQPGRPLGSFLSLSGMLKPFIFTID
jgi:hypothetical protein